MKRPPRIVIVGAAGRLGQALEARFSRDATVIGLARPEIDLSSPQSIRHVLEPLKFDHLILPAAMTAVDACETNQDQAYAVNAVAPGLILGETGTRIRDRFDALPETERARVLAAIPAGRPGSADEIAAIIAFLLTGAAGYINGATIAADGAAS